MAKAAFLIPGDLDLPTGGYAYARAVLGVLGPGLIHVPLPGGYPDPAPEDLAETARQVAALPQGTPLLIDGLAYGAMPAEVIMGFARPIVALCHHPLAYESGLAPARARALHALEQAALALAARVITTSQETARLLSADFAVSAQKITVAEPGTARRPRAVGSSGGPLRLLAVGSIVPRKGYDVLIEALAPLKARDWHLSIVGAARDADCHEALQAAIRRHGLEGRVALVGALDEAALDTLYAQTDLFVSASLYEGYGMVLAEALQRGLALVTTTGGAAAQTVPEGAGLKVPPGDVEALSAALARAMDEPALRRELAEAACRAGQALPRWEESAAIIARVLKEVS